jgi:hypothetical protein
MIINLIYHIWKVTTCINIIKKTSFNWNNQFANNLQRWVNAHYNGLISTNPNIHHNPYLNELANGQCFLLGQFWNIFCTFPSPCNNSHCWMVWLCHYSFRKFLLCVFALYVWISHEALKKKQMSTMLENASLCTYLIKKSNVFVARFGKMSYHMVVA